MKRLTLSVLFILFLFSCESKVNIPAPQLSGGVPDIKVLADDTGGKTLNAWATVPFDIKREQIRPTLLSTFKALKEKYPSYESIIIFLCPSEDLYKMGILAGRAAYGTGTLEIDYGVPSDKQIADWNADIGKPLFPGDSKLLNDLPPLTRITKEDYDIGEKVFLCGIDVSKRDNEQPPQKRLSDEHFYKSIGQKTGLSAKKAHYYYQLFQMSYSTTWGKETIKL